MYSIFQKATSFCEEGLRRSNIRKNLYRAQGIAQELKNGPKTVYYFCNS